MYPNNTTILEELFEEDITTEQLVKELEAIYNRTTEDETFDDEDFTCFLTVH